MTTVTLITGDSPGNQALTAAVVNQDVVPPTTDITTDASLAGSLADVAPVTPADKPNATGPTSQTFTLTVSGTGPVMGSVTIYGSNDGQSWAGLGVLTAQGNGTATGSLTITSPYTYWTSDTTFCTPGATCAVTMTF